MPDFEFVVTHESHSETFDVYDARVLDYSVSSWPTVVDRVQVTLTPETPVDLFTAAAVAAEQLAEHGFTVTEDITSYGSHDRGQMARAA